MLLYVPLYRLHFAPSSLEQHVDKTKKGITSASLRYACHRSPCCVCVFFVYDSYHHHERRVGTVPLAPHRATPPSQLYFASVSGFASPLLASPLPLGPSMRNGDEAYLAYSGRASELSATLTSVWMSWMRASGLLALVILPFSLCLAAAFQHALSQSQSRGHNERAAGSRKLFPSSVTHPC